MSEENNSITLDASEIDSGSVIINPDTPMKRKKFKCRKCNYVCEGIGLFFHRDEGVWVDRDYKFCYVCWLNMIKQFCGEVDEVAE